MSEYKENPLKWILLLVAIVVVAILIYISGVLGWFGEGS
jgi:hypothetical protein